MLQSLNNINKFLYNDFVFFSRYKIWRHVIYWSFNILLWSVFWEIMSPNSFLNCLFINALWIPVYILFSYPLAYLAVPGLLLKGRILEFFLLVIAWACAGLVTHYYFTIYLYTPLLKAAGIDHYAIYAIHPLRYLEMVTSAAFPVIIKFFKLLTIKKLEWIKAQQEKMLTELQLMKAQVNPDFLFKTLKNIYSLSVEQSIKTPSLILKLSALLSYMLYDCKAAEVRLEKELEIMKNYVDLEAERYGGKIDVSWNAEGNAGSEYIAPLLILPLLENAFKHGTKNQIDTCWLSIDISVKHRVLLCKIANSKSENDIYREDGKGINNLRKRMEHIYPGQYDLRMNDEGNFYVVSLIIKLSGLVRPDSFLQAVYPPKQNQKIPA